MLSKISLFAFLFLAGFNVHALSLSDESAVINGPDIH
jgi:hypothetical protein